MYLSGSKISEAIKLKLPEKVVHFCWLTLCMVHCCGSMAGSGIFKEIVDGDIYKYYADGEWKVSASGKSIGVVNPTTLKPQFKVQGL